MIRYVNPNFIKASNLILVSAGLVIVNYLLAGTFMAYFELAVVFFTIALLVVTALLIRKGYNWAKWVYIVLTILGLFTFFNTLPALFKVSILTGCISILQNTLYVLAVVLLLIPSRQPVIDFSAETDII